VHLGLGIDTVIRPSAQRTGTCTVRHQCMMKYSGGWACAVDWTQLDAANCMTKQRREHETAEIGLSDSAASGHGYYILGRYNLGLHGPAHTTALPAAKSASNSPRPTPSTQLQLQGIY